MYGNNGLALNVKSVNAYQIQSAVFKMCSLAALFVTGCIRVGGLVPMKTLHTYYPVLFGEMRSMTYVIYTYT